MARPTDEELERIAAGLAPFDTHIILTGAGFSKPWGGYLTAELWSVMIADRKVRTRPNVDAILHAHLNFEEALATLETTRAADFADEDRSLLREVVTRAFGVQDKRVRNTDPGLSMMLVDIIQGLASSTNQTTCLFTLNQDLVMERFAIAGDRPRILVPGVSGEEWWFGGKVSTAPWTRPSAQVPVREFSPADFNAAKGSISYIKLHGSANWFEPGGNVAVLGGAKEEAIARFPILRMNMAIFRTALTQAGARLLVIGYGFGDDHINSIIAAGVSTGLKVWVVDPRSPAEIRAQLSEGKVGSGRREGTRKRGQSIWRAVVGHSPGPFGDLFDVNRVEGQLFRSEFWDD